jgi:hypothetical protein
VNCRFCQSRSRDEPLNTSRELQVKRDHTEGESPMNRSSVLPILITLAISGIAQNASPGPTASSLAKSIGLFAYPKNRQNADQQLKDETECYRSAGQQTGVDPQARPPTPPSLQEQEAAQKRAAQQAAKEVPKGGAVKDRPRGRPVALRSVPSPGTPALAQPLARLPVPCVVDASRRNLRKRLGSKPRNRQRWRSSSRRHRQQPSTRGS